jgi:hypothetical protein
VQELWHPHVVPGGKVGVGDVVVVGFAVVVVGQAYFGSQNWGQLQFGLPAQAIMQSLVHPQGTLSTAGAGSAPGTGEAKANPVKTAATKIAMD